MELDGDDIFEELMTIRDPEKPYLTLAELNVVARERCSVHYDSSFSPRDDPRTPPKIVGHGGIVAPKRKGRATVTVELLPTVPHCHLMSIICLAVVVRLRDALPVGDSHWRIVIKLCPDSHNDQKMIEKQANDKERVAAALESDAVQKEIRKLICPMQT
jgi:metal-sulfur cluster biosynthetic enzyme